MDYQLKQSGEKETFTSGAHRDSQEGKPRYELIPALSLRRVADLYTKGAEHYGDWNWAKGMPFTRFLSSLHRHLQQFVMGEDDEDHLAAIVFNAMAIMYFQEREPFKWDDRGQQREFFRKNLTPDKTEPKNRARDNCPGCGCSSAQLLRTQEVRGVVWEVRICRECHTERFWKEKQKDA